MQKYKSFEAYLQSEYYNEIFEAVEKHLSERNIASSRIYDATETELDDVHVAVVSFERTGGYAINFYAKVQADINIYGRGRRDYDYDQKSEWVIISFSAVLKDGLHDVQITETGEFRKDKFDTDTLSKYLVPYLYAKDIESKAEDFLSRYCPQALAEPMAIPIDELLDKMKLTMHEAPLPNTKFGKILFGEKEAEVYEEGMIVKKMLMPGTILVNKDVVFMRNIGSLNNTIVHECVHWDRHSLFFEMQRLLNSEITSLVCEVVEEREIKDTGIEAALKWMEKQANALTPRILMPAKTTRRKINELLTDYHIAYPEKTESDIMESVIKELADFFQVSIMAAKIRATELGFMQAQGVFNYVEGKYLPSFSFKNSSLKRNETYIVDSNNAAWGISFDTNLKEITKEADFIHVDYLFCINDKKYVERGLDGNMILTEYARQHVDECCLKFSQRFKTTEHHDDHFVSMCSLARDVDASAFCESNVIDDEDTQNVKEKAIELNKVNDESGRIMEIYKNLPNSFSGTLDAHIKRRKKEDGSKMTNEELEFRTGISEKSIRTYRKEETNISFGTVCALCIGLHLHPFLSEDLIKKSKNDYPNTQEGLFCKFLINHHYMDSLELCNDKLIALGYKPWGNPEKII